MKKTSFMVLTVLIVLTALVSCDGSVSEKLLESTDCNEVTFQVLDLDASDGTSLVYKPFLIEIPKEYTTWQDCDTNTFSIEISNKIYNFVCDLSSGMVCIEHSDDDCFILRNIPDFGSTEYVLPNDNIIDGMTIYCFTTRI